VKNSNDIIKFPSKDLIIYLNDQIPMAFQAIGY